MKANIAFFVRVGLVTTFLFLPSCGACETGPTLSTESILRTVTNDSRLQSMEELHDFFRSAPRSTPYIDEIEFRTRTEEFDLDKQKYTLRFYPKGWGETASTQRLLETRNQSQELSCEEQFRRVLKDRYDLLIDYLETRVLMDIEKELLVNLEDQIRVLQALGPGDMAFDVGRLIDAQDDQLAHRLRRVQLEERLTGLEHWIRQLTGCGDRFSVQTKGLVTAADIRLFVNDFLEPAKASSQPHPFLADRQQRVRLAEEAYHLEVAKNRDFISFFEVSYDQDDRDEMEKAVSLELGISLPFIHKDQDDIVKRRIKWMEAKIDFTEAEQKWSQKREFTRRQLVLYLDQYDVLTARKMTGDAATSYEVYRKMDGVNPLELLKIRESILKNDIRIQQTRYSVLRRFVDFLDLSGKLGARPLVNYLSATQEKIL